MGFAWIVVLAFLRISTRRAIFPRPLTTGEATGVVEHWLAQPAAVTVQPTGRHLGVLQGLLGPLGTGGNLVNDAHLAALAVEHGAEIVSFDTDFRRFGGVGLHRPS